MNREKTALEQSKEYFKNELSASVCVDKYLLKDKEGNHVEFTPNDMHKRLASEFARIDSEKYGLNYQERYDVYFDAVKEFQRVVPQGSPMAAIGNPYQVMSASNCVVVASPEDSMGGIMKSGMDFAQLMKRRCVEENVSVYTKEKGLIKIKDIEVGMSILSFDINSKETLYKSVLDKFYTEVDVKDRLLIKCDDGTELKTSSKHPVLIYDNDNFVYKNCGELSVGEYAVKPSVHSFSKCSIVSIEQDNTSSSYIDIEVEGTNNFYAGNFGLVNIHNCGVGIDISTLRPEGMAVNNAAGTTSGAWSFADFFSYVTRMVGQFGRRGAALISMAGNHPDVAKFAVMKRDLVKVTGANVSIKLSDEFLKAVENDEEYEQKFPVDSDTPQFSRKVKAREVWNVIVESATKFAEPGLLLWDNIINNLPAHVYPEFKTISTNPCCFSANSKVSVVTRNGIKDIKQVSSNDEVWIDSEKVWAKTSGYFTAGVAQTYKVTFSNKKTLFITDNHKLEKFNSKELVQLKDLRVKDKISLQVNKPTNKTGLKKSNNHLTEMQRACQRASESFRQMTPDDATQLAVSAGIIDNDGQLTEHYQTKTNLKKQPKYITIKPAKYVTIKSIEPPTVEEVGCIEVEKFHKFTANGIISGNSEIALSAFDSCRLISLNLTGYIRNAFEDGAYFDFDLYEKDIRTAMQMADNLVDLELELIKKIQSMCEPGHEYDLWQKLHDAGFKGRRTGLGTHGLADALAQLKIKYDSNESLEMVDRIYKTLRDCAYDQSCELAKTRGAFPVFDYELEQKCHFIQRLPKSILAKMKQTGRRNIALLTQAPTGSVGIVSKLGESDTFNVSSGVEPAFRNVYLRRRKIDRGDVTKRVDFIDKTGDSWQEYKVFHSNVQYYLDKMGLDENAILPDYFVTSNQINWEKRVELQAVEQQYIDHSISSTINLPKGTKEEVVGKIYLDAWKKGLKGVTVYVDGCRDGVLLEVNSKGTDESGRPLDITSVNSPKRPKSLPCDIHHVKFKGNNWVVLVGKLNDQPYEVFAGSANNLQVDQDHGEIVKMKKGIYGLKLTDGTFIDDIRKEFDNSEYAWTTRMLSASLRHGVPVDFIVEQLSKDGGLFDINKVLSRVLKKYIKDGTKVRTSTTCSQCGSKDLIYSEGCMSCSACGNTKCN